MRTLAAQGEANAPALRTIRFARNRGVFELSWSRELTMLASLGVELLVRTRCGVGGGCGAIGWRI